MNNLNYSPVKFCFAKTEQPSFSADAHVKTFFIEGHEVQNNNFFVEAKSGSFGGNQRVISQASFPIQDLELKINEIYETAKKLGFKTDKTYTFTELRELSKTIRKLSC